jgi:DNA-binding NarL/FixJ family response regulator
MKQLEVLIADDSEFMRMAYKRILESQSNLKVAAMATNGEEAWMMAKEVEPDVAILDVWMPKVDGIKAAHEIRRQLPGTAIVVISSYDDLTFVADLMQNGVERKAYLLKHSISNITDLVNVVEAVYEGQTVLDSGIVQRLSRLFCKYSDEFNTSLSDMEQDLLGLMAEGHDDERICGTLHINHKEVAAHSRSLYENLGIVGGSDPEQRILAVRAFVSQIHEVPLARVYDAVS